MKSPLKVKTKKAEGSEAHPPLVIFRLSTYGYLTWYSLMIWIIFASSSGGSLPL